MAMRGSARLLHWSGCGCHAGIHAGHQGSVGRIWPQRIREAPISESAMVGAALGAALFGQRPIVEISFGEFLPAAMNQLINQAPNLHYMTGGTARLPVVADARGRRSPRRPPAGLLRLVRPRAGLEGGHASHTGGREGDDDSSHPRRWSGAVLRGNEPLSRRPCTRASTHSKRQSAGANRARGSRRDGGCGG
jgi:hypothetical protein